MISRSVLFAFVLVCGVVRCEAAPSLSFNGVQLGQKWDEFFKVRPKAYVYDTGYSPPGAMGVTEQQKLAAEAKGDTSLLMENFNRKPFWYGLYYFSRRKSAQLEIRAEPHRGYRNLEEVNVLREPLKKVVSQLGPPTAYGVTGELSHHVGNPRNIKGSPLLIWETARQCAYVELHWPRYEGEFSTFKLVLLDRPWSSLDVAHGEWLTRPVLLWPNQDEETQRRWLFALLEEVKPNSTNNIRLLRPVAGVDFPPRPYANQ